MTTAAIATTTVNAQPTLAQAAKDLAKATAASVRRAITNVTAKKPDERPAEGDYEASLESLDILDTMMKVSGTDREEPVVLISMIVEDKGRKWRLYYRNPVSYAKKDLPRVRNFNELGGISALMDNPEIIRKMSATISVEYAGDTPDKPFTNVRINGTATYNAAQKRKLAALADMLGEEPSKPTPAITTVE